MWLARSWRDPAYQSSGHWFLLALVGAVALSVASGPASGSRAGTGLVTIFLGAAGLRLLGQALAVNILSALALAVDVYAIARLLRVDRRPYALSPLWLALFFLFALPLTPLLERALGFPLQMVSASLSCVLLAPFFSELTCDGVRLQVDQVDVLVDLPCSGATGLLLMCALWTGMNVLHRPPFWVALVGGVAVLALALIGNALRISLLAGGLALGLDTMQPTLHAVIGLATQIAAALPVLAYYRPKAGQPCRSLAVIDPPRWALAPMAGAAACIALLIVQIPPTPVDRSAEVAQKALPQQLLGHRQETEALTPVEQYYFEAFGGFAQKASYGALGLNLVQTAAPLRHLHAPATCLLGMGYDVTFLGTRFDPTPTSIYRATSPDGQVWHVAVSYVSDTGQQTASVGEAVWSWLTGRSHRWTSVQRITPFDLSPEARAAFEQAALAALEI